MKTFKEFIIENPEIDETPKSVIHGFAQAHQQSINDYDHTKSKDIGDSCKVKSHNDGSKTYYHLVAGQAKEFSHITKDGIHKATYRDTDGHVKYIHKFMKYHAQHEGPVRTYKSNSKGAINLWKSLIKSKPMNKTFHMIDSDKETPIHHANIDKKENEIWGDGKSNVSLEMRHHK